MDIPALSEQNLLFVLQISLVLVCGLIIGAEKELKNKPAGISTQTLVIGGSMIFTFISRNAVADDPARIAAQVVSGIGFLGAGLILRSETSQRVTNVTTAASIWYSAAVGMAIGFEYYFIAFVASVFLAIVSRLPSIRPEDRQTKESQ